MLQSLTPIGISVTIFACTFGAAILGMAPRVRIPDDHLTEDSKDVIKLVMGLVATMTALVPALLIASANSSYQMQTDELQRASASIVELDGLLVHYGPEASQSRQKLREAVAAETEKFWPKDDARPKRPIPAEGPAEVGAFYESIARLSPTTDAQRFIRSTALEIGSSLGHMRALMPEQRVDVVSGLRPIRGPIRPLSLPF
jgi:hypothetical protein